MRTFLRAIATVQVWVAALGVVGIVGLYFYRQAFGAAWPSLETAARGVAFFTLQALAGGLLWRMADPAPPPPTGVGRWRPFRVFLRMLALAQLAVALPLAVTALSSGYARLPLAPGRRADEALWTMLVVPAALGLACLGGVLWCVVRVAYPREAAPIPPRPANPPGAVTPPEP